MKRLVNIIIFRRVKKKQFEKLKHVFRVIRMRCIGIYACWMYTCFIFFYCWWCVASASLSKCVFIYYAYQQCIVRSDDCVCALACIHGKKKSWWCSIWFCNKRYSYQNVYRLIAIVSMITCNNESHFMIAPLKFNRCVAMKKTKCIKNILFVQWRSTQTDKKKHKHRQAHEYTLNLIGCNNAVWSVICKVVIQLYNFLTLFIDKNPLTLW